MSLVRRGRIFYLIVRELSHKYTKALVLGFLVGFALAVGFWQGYPLISKTWLAPVDRFGAVGEFTPTTLPASIQHVISSGLTQLSADGTPLPALATSWVATDSGKTFTFYLKDNALWHGGQPVEAKDVNYNIRNVTFTPVDPHTLRATLDAPYSPFPGLVEKPLFGSGLRGFGPYRVVAIRLKGDAVQYLKLVPVEKKTGLAREYRFYRTEATAVTAYKVGDVDTLEELTSAHDLDRWGKTKVEEHTKYNRIVSLYFNLSTDVLSERGVRQALGYAVPDELPGERAFSPIPKTSWAYTDKVKKYSYDAPQAKKLLSAAKVASQSASLTISTFSQYVDVAQTIANSWTDIGIPTDVKVISSISPEYQVLLSAQDVPPDPDQYPFWHSTQTQNNITGYNNPKIDKLLEDGRQELNTDKRKTIYADFQRRLVEDAPAIFLYYAKTFSIKRR